MTAERHHDPATPPPAAPRYRSASERFMSRSFGLGPGAHADPARVRGYPIDFTAKATEPHPWAGFASDPGRWLWVALIQWALGAYDRWLGGEGEQWLAGAREAADLLIRHQASDGPRDGAWIQTRPYPHTFRVAPPWVSGMAQGEGASLLVRLHLETGETSYAEAAIRALRPLSLQSFNGGASAPLEGGLLPEEYPTRPPSLVLNGAIFGLWGLRDVGVGLGDRDASSAFAEGVDTLTENVDRWDTGFWSRYDLFPHAVTNVASPAYHALHVMQLEATHALAPRPELAAAAARFARYAASPARRTRAFASKVLFRLAVPRSRRLARALPWSRL